MSTPQTEAKKDRASSGLPLALVRPLHFRGHDFDASKLLSVDPTDSHSTGTMACQWSYGFTVRFPGNSVNILLPPPSQYGYGGAPTREQYKIAADKMRADFLRLLWPNTTVRHAEDGAKHAP